MNEKNSVVAHPIFGEGVILETRWDGAEAQVKFRSGLNLWLPAKWLKPLAIETIDLDQTSSKRMLEAFRLGVVPHQEIEYFTFGRGYEINEVKQGLDALKKGKGGIYLIEGTYGSGKTHLLEYARHISLRYQLVTTFCELNTQETPLHRPKRVYRELVANLRYIKDDNEYVFRDLLRESTKIEISDHCFLTPVLRRLKDIDHSDLKSEVFWQWIEGESTKEYATDPLSPFRISGGYRIPALYDFSTASDFYTYIITGLSFLINKIGLGGLVVILDEVETLTHTWDYLGYSRGLGFLEGLIRATLNDPSLTQIDTHLIHNNVRPTPYIYGESHIFLILATTPVHGLRSLENITNLIEKKSYLRPFSKNEITVIYQNLQDVYKCAYPSFEIGVAQKDNILSAALKRSNGELREFIKFSVEAFDWVRLGTWLKM